MHEVLVNRLGGVSLPRKSVVRLTDRPDMTLDVYCGRKTTIQQRCNFTGKLSSIIKEHFIEKKRLVYDVVQCELILHHYSGWLVLGLTAL